MKITMKTTYAGPRGTVQPGRTVDMPDAEGRALVAGGYAVRAEEDTAGEGGRTPAQPKTRKSAGRKKPAGEKTGKAGQAPPAEGKAGDAPPVDDPQPPELPAES